MLLTGIYVKTLSATQPQTSLRFSGTGDTERKTPMAGLVDNIDRAEFEAKFAALEATNARRLLGTATWSKLVKCIEQNGAADPDTGANWIALSEANLDDNFRVGLKSRKDFEVLLLQAMTDSAAAV